jgi:glyoxylase-like metal-dependent hydrolase (beta-lactamase superfamily II)
LAAYAPTQLQWTATINEQGAQTDMTPDTSTNVELQTNVFTSAARAFGRHGQTFSPTTSTIVVGETEAVLIDAQFIKDEVSALGDMIEETGKTLTTIYVTHGHADHYFGLGQLLTRFPQARAVATGPVLAYIEASHDAQVKQWEAMFGDDGSDAKEFPAPLEGDVIELDGNELRVIEIGQGDIAPSTIVHIPSIDAVIAGDVVYNRIHLMLALGGPDQWQAWIGSIDRIADLGAKTIVAGHKRPDANDDDLATILDGTRDYIRDFRNAVNTSTTAEEVVEIMTAKYDQYGNLTTLRVSAKAALPGQS